MTSRHGPPSHSRTFCLAAPGTPRIAIVLLLTALVLLRFYFWRLGDTAWLWTLGIFLLTAAFNIGVRVDDTGIRVSVLWIPVLHIRFEDYRP